MEVPVSQFLVSVGLVVLSASLNVAGVVALKHAAQHASPLAAIAGCLAFAATSLIFVKLLASSHDLSVVAIVTSIAGMLAVTLIDAVYYGAGLSVTQWIGVGLLILGLALVGASGA